MSRARGRASVAVALSVVLFATLATTAALADDAPVGQLAGDRAVTLAEQGMKEFEQGHWDVAYQRFQEANVVVPAPVFQLYMGRARRNQGKLVEARAILRAVVDEPLSEGAPPAFTKAREDAKTELTDVERSIPSIVVTVAGAMGQVTVTLDGALITTGKEVDLDPGAHTVTATGEGRTGSTDVSVQAGKRAEKVSVTLADRVVQGPGPGPSPVADDGSALGTVGWVLAGVGAGSLIAGAVTGGMALSLNSSIKERCSPVCDESERAGVEDDLSRMDTLGNVSTATLVIGSVLVATGVTLVIVDASSSDTDGAAAARPAARFRVGPGAVFFSVDL